MQARTEGKVVLEVVMSIVYHLFIREYGQVCEWILVMSYNF